MFVSGTWGLAFSLATPPLLGWGVYAYLPNQSICFCNWRTSVSYTFFMVGTCFGGPCTVMTFSYVNIVREIRASKRRIAAAQQKNIKSMKDKSLKSDKNQNEGTFSATDGSRVIHKREDNHTNTGDAIVQTPKTPTVPSETYNTATKDKPKLEGSQAAKVVSDPMSPRSRKAEKRRQEHIRLALSFAVVILVFIFSWLPFCITMFLNVFSDTPIPRIPDMITLLLGCANSLCNPIIYGVMNTRFRAGYKRLFTAPCRRMGLACVRSDQGQGVTLMLNETLSKT